MEITSHQANQEYEIEAAQLLQSHLGSIAADRLVSYKHKGISIDNKDGKSLAILAGNYGKLDHRFLNDELLLATVDNDKQQAVLTAFNAENSLWTDKLFIKKPNFEIESVCLYDDQTNTFLFLLGEDGYGQQWLVANHQGLLTQPQQVRALNLSPHSESCQVNDNTGQLYISEEHVGTWVYDADPEAELSRSLVHTSSNQQTATHVGISLIPQGFVTLDSEQEALLVYKQDNKQWLLASQYPLPELDDAEDVSTRWQNDKVDILIKHDDGFEIASFPWSKQAQSAANVESIPTVSAEAETDPVVSLGDAADDPAIWVNQHAPEQSLVLATDKQRGLLVYDLKGRLVQDLPVGRINNIDIRTGFDYKDTTIDIAVASNRDHNSLHIFSITPETGVVTELTELPTQSDEIYGLCLFKDHAANFYVIANDKDGRFFQYQLQSSQQGLIALIVRQFSVDSQPEGCVADDQTEQLFLGEEESAIWVMDARADASTTMTKVSETNEHLVADIEGMSIYHGKKQDYLIVSSQGNNSYVLFDTAAPYQYRGRFRVDINTDKMIDGSSETDGLDVTSANLGGIWSEGILVVQDGHNRLPMTTQNFKYVPWSPIAKQLNLD